ncbi:MAG TPA: hypothetical protein VHX61_03745 [Rhizomicrobium sp.]|jgi:hypothetical protein|nr:hypothetical protein [Rhizomicrobium sp.]
MGKTGLRTRNSHSKAPKELGQFAFLIGKWRFDARFKSASGEWETYHGTWTGRYILDGRAIADEYRMLGSDGEIAVLGVNFRVYDAARQVWNIKWLNALDGTWADLTSEEFGGVTFEGQSVSYVFREPLGATRGWAEAYTRATYTIVSPALFTWRGDKSDDRAAWKEFMAVECHRAA